MEIAKIKVLEALLSRLSDDKVTTSGGMSWRSGYEAGFQAGFQQGMALSQLPIQQVQPRPAFQSLYPLQRAAPFSSPLPTFISPNVPHGQRMLGQTMPSTSQDSTSQSLATIHPSEIDWN